MKLPVNYTKLSWMERADVREEYIDLQDGKCMFCDEPLDGQPSADILRKPLDLTPFPPNFLKYPIHLQHNHNTGLTEGAVHAYCNGILWQYHGR